MSQADHSQQGSPRIFARACGPYFLLVPPISAARASSRMPVSFHTFPNDPMWQWVLGTILLLWGSVIVACHQYWRGVAAVVVSLLGWWSLTIRGALILAVPYVYNAAGNLLEQSVIPLVRSIFEGFGVGRPGSDLRRLGRKAESSLVITTGSTAGSAVCHG